MPMHPPTVSQLRRQQVPRKDNRPSAAARGYDRLWQRIRIRHLRHNPFCAECLKEGFEVAASVVDHIIPHKGDRWLFLNPRNRQSLCIPHHGKKTAREGAFGRPMRPIAANDGALVFREARQPPHPLAGLALEAKHAPEPAGTAGKPAQSVV